MIVNFLSPFHCEIFVSGDVYESSGNLREKLPSETSQNVITESSSSAESDTHPPTAHSAPLHHPTDSEGIKISL